MLKYCKNVSTDWARWPEIVCVLKLTISSWTGGPVTPSFSQILERLETPWGLLRITIEILSHGREIASTLKAFKSRKEQVSETSDSGSNLVPNCRGRHLLLQASDEPHSAGILWLWGWCRCTTAPSWDTQKHLRGAVAVILGFTPEQRCSVQWLGWVGWQEAALWRVVDNLSLVLIVNTFWHFKQH